MRTKIIHIITRLDRGGSSRILLQLAKSLDKDLYDVSIISGLTINPEEDIESYIKDNKIEIMFLPELRREIGLWHDIRCLFRLYGLLKRNKPQIVHTHTSKAGILGRWAAYFAKVPHIVHMPHGHVFYGYFGKIKSYIVIIIERFTSHITECIITLTEISKEEHIGLGIGDNNKIVAIHNGIDIDDGITKAIDIAEEKKKISIPIESPVVGLFSRLEIVKGIDYFIDAAQIIIKEFPGNYFIVVGEGGLEEKYTEKVKAMGLASNILFLGYRRDYKKLIILCDMVVLPSLNEGFGLILAEAALFRKPVVATRVGGIPEVVIEGHTGILVPPKDKHALAEAIMTLLKDRTLRLTMGDNARKHVESNFSINDMYDKITMLYKNLLDNSNFI